MFAYEDEDIGRWKICIIVPLNLSFMKDLFELREKDRPVREKYTLNLINPKWNYVSFHYKLLRVQGLKNWNSLPAPYQIHWECGIIQSFDKELEWCIAYFLKLQKFTHFRPMLMRRPGSWFLLAGWVWSIFARVFFVYPAGGTSWLVSAWVEYRLTEWVK